MPRLERRRYPRFSVSLPLRLKRMKNQKEGDVETLLSEDISRSGLRFRTRERIALGESIEVEVTLAAHGPAGADILVIGKGLIVRSEKSHEAGWYQLAAAFADPPAGHEPRWDRLAAAFDEPSSGETDD